MVQIAARVPTAARREGTGIALRVAATFDSVKTVSTPERSSGPAADSVAEVLFLDPLAHTLCGRVKRPRLDLLYEVLEDGILRAHLPIDPP